MEPSAAALATDLSFSINEEPHPLCLLAAEKLQQYLRQQQWDHDFRLIGKMFGVLVVRTRQHELGYLAAFSGKLAGTNDHPDFVPPIFDGLTEGSFVNRGMTKLTQINEKIKLLETSENNSRQVHHLKVYRKAHSINLQNKIFDQYHFLNKAGVSKSLLEIFNRKPPAGAGECAAPKLLQYAFQHHMEPLALAEFWWGLSPKSAHWKHGHFYPPCKEKCSSILQHMLTV